ncbi:MAG TPA: MMPL family transporter [Anaeromyxobacteraceae bacterium]|nr:MMPL family transporter [Anaeromyxobacteraceae bacterium]
MPARRLDRILHRVYSLRLPILVAYAFLVPAGAWLAGHVETRSGLDRLVVPSDPDVVATEAFHRIFPESPVAMVLLEADDPWRPDVLDAVGATGQALRAIPGVTAVSILDVYSRARGAGPPTAERAEAVRRFATGTDFFRRQGFLGDGFLGVAVAFEARGPAERDAKLAAIDAVVDRAPGGAITGVRKVGGPYVESWIERASREASLRHFPVFGLFVVGLALFLYRSGRALVAIMLTVGAAVALAVGAGKLLGFSFSVVSALVPLTVMVTTVATLVYLHSRFVDQPASVPLEEHRVRALANKFLPVTASSAAGVLGFAALSVSPIGPVREMGIWTAVGLALSWVVAFTLYPALQATLRTPTRRAVRIRSGAFDRAANAIPRLTWRWRHALVAASLAAAAAGAIALFGVPGRLAPMQVGLDVLEYVDPRAAVYRDFAFFREHVAGLNAARVWVRTPPGAITDPEVLRGLDDFAEAVQRIPGVSSVVGPTSFLRLRRYAAGQGDALPRDPEAMAALAGDMEQLLLMEPELQAFVDVATLGNAQLTVVFLRGDGPGLAALSRGIDDAWRGATEHVPALRQAEMRLVGESVLAGKIGASLVPTLAESFAITAVLIFLAFLAVFRSASARLLAMIPSVFAILVTFLAMRLAGASLNVATILIATTVLGTTENDQIHFFHHLQEGDRSGGLEGALRHTLRVAGGAILFATLINAGGFLALGLSSFPPLRQFGVITAGAFLLAMIADFTALPAALWLLRRERPAPIATSEPPDEAQPGATRDG